MSKTINYVISMEVPENWEIGSDYEDLVINGERFCMTFFWFPLEKPMTYAIADYPEYTPKQEEVKKILDGNSDFTREVFVEVE